METGNGYAYLHRASFESYEIVDGYGNGIRLVDSRNLEDGCEMDGMHARESFGTGRLGEGHWALHTQSTIENEVVEQNFGVSFGVSWME